MSIYESKLYIEDLHVAAEHTLGIEKLRGKTVLVTGASGTIGSFIVDMLCEYGSAEGKERKESDDLIRVVACGRNVEKLQKRFCRYTGNSDNGGEGNISFAKLDILDGSSFDNLPDTQVDYIIHAAGNAYPSAFIDRFEETVKGNILGTDKLLGYAREHGCKRFVYVSSGEVYSLDEDYRNSWNSAWNDQGGTRLYFEQVMKDVAEKGARSCYPVSKAAAEAMCLGHDNTIVVRPCHTFGPGITGSDDRAHVQFVKRAKAGKNIILNSAGTQLRSYNYAADATSGILSAMLANTNNRIYDICSEGNEITIRGLAQLIAQTAGVEVITKEADEREKSLSSPIQKQVLNPDALGNIGWKKAFDLYEGVSHYIEIIKESYV